MSEDFRLFIVCSAIACLVVSAMFGGRPKPKPKPDEEHESDELVWLMVSPWEWVEVPLSEAWDCGGVFLFDGPYQAMRAAEAEREFWRAVAEDE